MNRSCCLHFAIIIQSIACGQINQQNFQDVPEHFIMQKIAFDTGEIVIFNINADWWLKKRLDSSQSFSLTNSNIQTIEKIFKKCLNENNMSSLHYRRQYVPYIDKKGHRCVWINCFCSDYGNDYADWKRSIILVEDGGSCYLNLIIDLTDMSYSNFEINGSG